MVSIIILFGLPLAMVDGYCVFFPNFSSFGIALKFEKCVSRPTQRMKNVSVFSTMQGTVRTVCMCVRTKVP